MRFNAIIPTGVTQHDTTNEEMEMHRDGAIQRLKDSQLEREQNRENDGERKRHLETQRVNERDSNYPSDRARA